MVASEPGTPQDSRKGFSSGQLSAAVVFAILLTVFGGWAFVRFYLQPQTLPVVRLSQQEQLGLDRKLAFLGIVGNQSASDPRIAEPRPYSEEGASRVVEFSERELNSLIAQDQQWGSRAAIDLADDLVSLTALMSVPQDSPFMAGQKIRLTAGAELAFRNDRPVLILKGVSIMGVPLPAAWLGNLKNVDLISEFGDDPGFWQSFAAGIEAVEVRDGRLRVELSK